MPVKIFFSYSHKDEALRDKLEVQLATLKHEGLIEPWHDRRITAGSPLDQRINARLEEADIILLLVSPDFLASQYCYGLEVTRALDRHKSGNARVIPVILRPCDWLHTPFKKLLATPCDGKPVTQWPDQDDAFQDIVTSIRNVIKNMTDDQSLSTTTAFPSEVPLNEASGSSNLRLRKTFTKFDKDSFLEESFEHIPQFFEKSLDELKEHNPGIQCRFRKIDPQHFSATVYRDGQDSCQCRIWLSFSSFTNGIAYSYNGDRNDNGYNELLSVVETDQALFLDPLLLFRDPSAIHHLTMDGAAELYWWGMLIKPLQQ